MTQINLLPPELQQRQRTRRLTAGVIGLGLVAAAVVGVLFFLQMVRLNGVNEELAAQEARNAGLQTRINRLQRFEELRSEAEARRTLIQGALANTIRWSGILRDVSLVLPDRMWLTSLSGTLTTTAPTDPLPPGTVAPTGTGLLGTIQFQGSSLDEPTLALWLTRLEQVPGWVNPWLSSAVEAAVANTEVFQFSTSVDLSAEVAVQGARL